MQEKAMDIQKLACATVEAFSAAVHTRSFLVIPNYFYLTTSHFPEMLMFKGDMYADAACDSLQIYTHGADSKNTISKEQEPPEFRTGSLNYNTLRTKRNYKLWRTAGSTIG